MYVITDPECPYCKKFDKIWPSLKKDYTLKVYFYNLPYHQKANAMSYYVLGGGTKATAGDRLIEIANNDKKWESFSVSNDNKIKYNKILDISKNIAITLGIKGVPTIFDKDGNIINWMKDLNK